MDLFGFLISLLSKSMEPFTKVWDQNEPKQFSTPTSIMLQLLLQLRSDKMNSDMFIKQVLDSMTNVSTIENTTVLPTMILKVKTSSKCSNNIQENV
jgi:hypothetical protein